MDAMSLSPRGIREHLKLNRPIYARTSAYGHFGRAPDADGGFSWEETDLADAACERTSPERRRDGTATTGGTAGSASRPASGGVHGRRAGPPAARAARRRLHGATLLPALAIDLARPLGPPRRCSPSRRRDCGSRSASAAASIWSRRPTRHPDIGFIGCEPFRNGVAKLLARASSR